VLVEPIKVTVVIEPLEALLIETLNCPLNRKREINFSKFDVALFYQF